MQQVLARYLLQHRTLILPQLATLHLVDAPALATSDNLLLQPPGHLIAVKPAKDDAQQLKLLSATTGKTVDDVKTALTQFTALLQTALTNGNVPWPGVGVWSKNGDQLSLTPVNVLLTPIHLNQEQLPIVAAEPKIAAGTTDLSATPSAKPMLWPAIAALLAALLVLAIYFYSKGLKTASQAAVQDIAVKEAFSVT